MVNGSGMMVKVLLTVLILALTAVGSLVVMGAGSVKDSLALIDKKVDTVEAKQVAYDKQQARVVLQLDAMAQALKVPTVVDTAAAIRVLNGDSL